jgi:hypothetical protein
MAVEFMRGGGGGGRGQILHYHVHQDGVAYVPAFDKHYNVMQ